MKAEMSKSEHCTELQPAGCRAVEGASHPSVGRPAAHMAAARPSTVRQSLLEDCCTCIMDAALRDAQRGAGVSWLAHLRLQELPIAILNDVFDGLYGCAGTVYAALRDAQRELGSDFWVMEAMSANAALSVATQWAARQRPMIHLPKWIRMPSKYEQVRRVPGRLFATAFMHDPSSYVLHGI